ncbi:hypothetical protein HPB49_021817 [Dermacentor silvarum]|uniref:Uncharacterized protein n=1 Tax=Dermacentor silvarum TaxID=543639 RepID=A0ACB8CT15_DERSI|nr:hypothetical protein HPB49_021817 [Dermacentor silvarum]
MPCINECGESCRLLEHRSQLNEVLLGACLELREDSRGKSRGDVLIAVVQSSTCGCVLYGSEEDSRKAKALNLVERLLGQHHCITAIEFNRNLTLRRSLLRSVKRHRSLKSVTVWGKFFEPEDAASMFETIKSLSQLKNLAFKVYDFEKAYGVDTDMFGSSLDLSMYHLTTLDVADIKMPGVQAGRLVQALIENTSITELTVGYLSKEDSTLQKLTLKSVNILDSRLLLRELIDAFGKMIKLEELNADIVLTRRIFVGTVALFAELVNQCATLHTLKLPSTSCGCQAPFWDTSAQRPDPKAAQCMDPWITALRKPNSALKQLCIDLRAFGEPECHAFFDAVADNNALRSVVVNSLPCIDRLDRVSTKIREQRLKDKVIIKGHYMDNSTKQLQKCPQISSTSIGASITLMPNIRGALRTVISALKFVGDHAHITTLWVNCDLFDRKAYSALTACLRGPSALTDVYLTQNHVWAFRTKQERRDVHAELVSALASNLKLVRVSVKGVLLSDDDLNVLADGATRSRRLIEFTTTPGCVSSAIHEAKSGEAGYCLIHNVEAFTGTSDFKNMALADIMESTRRNASAVSAAAQFVLGEQDGVEGARGIELMHDHPHLLEMVMEAADVTKAEATNMISCALRRVHRCSLEEFMRMAGVVKERVECIGHPGTRLADNNNDCWLHILSFLKIGDVLLN